MTHPIRMDAKAEIEQQGRSTASSNGIESIAATRHVNWINRSLPDPSEQRDYARDRAITAWSELLGELMEVKGITRAALAEKLNRAPSQVSRALSGAQNMTLRTLADILWACDYETIDPSRAIGPLGVVEVADRDAVHWLDAAGSTGSENPRAVFSVSLSQSA